MLSHKPLVALVESDLQDLLTERRPETRTLDYKRELNFSKDEDRRELARDISSFANASGGDLVYGVEEAKDENGKPLGYPSALLGVAGNFDDMKLRVENIVRDLIDPRVQGLQIHKVEGAFANGPIVVVRVPRSWIGPHMLSFQNQTHFFSRNSAGRHPLDVREIRAAFLASSEEATRIQRFRDARLGSIIAGETPVPIAYDGTVRTILHLAPMGERGSTSLDLERLRSSALLRPPGAGGWSHRYNLDGLLTYAGEDSERPSYSYAQAFRAGELEAVTTGHSNVVSSSPFELFAPALEDTVVEVASSFLGIYRDQHIAGPFVLMLAVHGARGASLWTGGQQWSHRKPAKIDRDLLVLPEMMSEAADEDARLVMRGAFDALWQSGGHPRSLSYDDTGKWTRRR